MSKKLSKEIRIESLLMAAAEEFLEKGYEEELKAKVKEKVIDIGIVIPDDYSKKLSQLNTNIGSPAVVKFYGSMGNMRYTVAAIMVGDTLNKQGLGVRKVILPSSISETFLEKKQPLNEFEGYVPGLISLAVLMILFTASASIVKENDKKTLFFSGSMFPLPKMNLLTIGGHSFGITDILPLSHTANAFNKILNYGAGINGVLFDIFMITLLTLIYFVVGLLLYQKRKLSRA
jgi:hypothetical protein